MFLLRRVFPTQKMSAHVLVFAGAIGLAWAAFGACTAWAATSKPSDGPNLRQRRAVRGISVSKSWDEESPELRELRLFEETTFSLPGALPIRIDEPEQRDSKPQGLPGAWNGTGDVPPVLRSPSQPNAHGVVADGRIPPKGWLADLQLPELPIRWDERLIRYLEYFKDSNRGRAIMTSWLQRMERYRAPFEKIMRRHGLPKDLIYLAMIESGFAPAATSGVGAGGIWQFMAGAARAYGLEVSQWVDARRDPERAAEAAALYLKDLYVRFGSWHLAFAAYNCGYGAVLQSISRYNSNDFWELAKHEAGLPWETTLYVPKILAAAIVGHNRKAFGYDQVLEDAPMIYDEVSVPAATTLASVARALRTDAQTIEALNPELIRRRVPPDRGAQTVRIPAGTTSIFRARFDNARDRDDMVTPIVLRFGETLEDVAKRYHMSAQQLRKLNELSSSSEVKGGSTIVVPDKKAERVAAQSEDEDDDSDSADDDEESDVTDINLVAVPATTFSYAGRERVFYKTRAGDSLLDICGAFSVSLANLVEWNNVDPDAKLQSGLVFQVFVPNDFDARHVALLDPSDLKIVTLGSEEFLRLQVAVRGKTRLKYKASEGDTMAKIARRYGLHPGDLARINQFSFNSSLKEGQEIVVYSPSETLPSERLGRRGGARQGTTSAGRSRNRDRTDTKDDKDEATKATEKTTEKNSAPAKANVPSKKPGTGLDKGPPVDSNKALAKVPPSAPPNAPDDERLVKASATSRSGSAGSVVVEKIETSDGDSVSPESPATEPPPVAPPAPKAPAGASEPPAVEPAPVEPGAVEPPPIEPPPVSP